MNSPSALAQIKREKQRERAIYQYPHHYETRENYDYMQERIRPTVDQKKVFEDPCKDVNQATKNDDTGHQIFEEVASPMCEKQGKESTKKKDPTSRDSTNREISRNVRRYKENWEVNP